MFGGLGRVFYNKNVKAWTTKNGGMLCKYCDKCKSIVLNEKVKFICMKTHQDIDEKVYRCSRFESNFLQFGIPATGGFIILISLFILIFRLGAASTPFLFK